MSPSSSTPRLSEGSRDILGAAEGVREDLLLLTCVTRLEKRELRVVALVERLRGKGAGGAGGGGAGVIDSIDGSS